MKRLGIVAVIVALILFASPCLAQQKSSVQEKSPEEHLAEQLDDCQFVYERACFVNALTNKYIHDMITDSNDGTQIIRLLQLKEEVDKVRILLDSHKKRLILLLVKKHRNKKEMREFMEDILDLLERNNSYCTEAGNMKEPEDTENFLKNSRESIQFYRNKYK